MAASKEADAAAATLGEDDDDLPTLEVAGEAERPTVRDEPEDSPSKSITEGHAWGSGNSTDVATATSSVAALELNKKADVYQLNLGHQETDRILDEVDGYCDAVLQSAGADAWMPVKGLATLLLKELGYEDMDQFEDALGGTFEQFVKALPHVDSKIQDDGSSCDGMLVLKARPPPPVDSGFTMTVTIRTSEDLWRTLYKAPDCTLEIPELEFEIGQSEKRELDAIFNHISRAMFNLAQHARQNFVSSDTRDRILETVEELSKLLDIEHPWKLVIRDKSGRSILKPDHGVTIVPDKVPAQNSVAETA